MAYNANTNFANEEKYLNSLAKSGSSGQSAWAKKQLKELNAAKSEAINNKINKDKTIPLPSDPIKKTQNTSAYTGTGYLQNLQNNVNDWQDVNLGNGKSIQYSQTLGNSKNGTAWIPGVGNVRVTIANGKVQETDLPIDTIITPDGSQQSWKINGATKDGYTSTIYDGNLSLEERTKTQGMTPALQEVLKNNPNLKLSGTPNNTSSIPLNTGTSGFTGTVIDSPNGVTTGFDFDSYLSQMQDFYNKQTLDFQNQLKANETEKLQADNYTKSNQTSLNNSVNNTVGVIGGNDLQNTVRTPGAQIKRNKAGQTGAISRYLTSDIWKNK